MSEPLSDCIFCQIISGQRPAQIVFEDEQTLAFLDQTPRSPGHCLLVPKEHHQTLPQLPPQLVGPLFSNARMLCQAVAEGLDADGSFLGINNRVSQSVPHLHVHIIPRWDEDGLNGMWPHHPYRDEQSRIQTQNSIRQAAARLSNPDLKYTTEERDD